MKLSLIIFFFGMQVWAGWAGNGGELIKDQNNIWYLDDLQTDQDDKIKYCVEISDEYVFFKSTIEKLIQNSLSEWKQFFSKYGFQNTLLGQNQYQFPDKHSRKMNLNFEKSDACPSEKSTILKFVFGKKEAEINEILKSNSENYLAFSARSEESINLYQPYGIIWINNWSYISQSNDVFMFKENYIKHLILHELGHVFGMPHNSVFVMDEEIADEIKKNQLSELYFSIGKIESEFWKYKLLKNDNLWLTAARRDLVILPANPFPDPTPKIIPGFARIEEMPMSFQKLFGLKNEKGFSLKLVKTKEENTLNLELMSYPTQTIMSFEGQFEFTKSRKNIGPSYYTKWITQSFINLLLEKEIYEKVYLDHDYFLTPSVGTFSIFNKSYPATLTDRRGVILKISNPETNEWWEIKNIKDNFKKN